MAPPGKTPCLSSLTYGDPSCEQDYLDSFVLNCNKMDPWVDKKQGGIANWMCPDDDTFELKLNPNQCTTILMSKVDSRSLELALVHHTAIRHCSDSELYARARKRTMDFVIGTFKKTDRLPSYDPADVDTFLLCIQLSTGNDETEGLPVSSVLSNLNLKHPIIGTVGFVHALMVVISQPLDDVPDDILLTLFETDLQSRVGHERTDSSAVLKPLSTTDKRSTPTDVRPTSSPSRRKGAEQQQEEEVQRRAEQQQEKEVQRRARSLSRDKQKQQKAADKRKKEAAEKRQKEAAEKRQKEAAEKQQKEAAEKQQKEAAEKQQKEVDNRKKKENITKEEKSNSVHKAEESGQTKIETLFVELIYTVIKFVHYTLARLTANKLGPYTMDPQTTLSDMNRQAVKDNKTRFPPTYLRLPFFVLTFFYVAFAIFICPKGPKGLKQLKRGRFCACFIFIVFDFFDAEFAFDEYYENVLKKTNLSSRIIKLANELWVNNFVKPEQFKSEYNTTNQIAQAFDNLQGEPFLMNSISHLGTYFKCGNLKDAVKNFLRWKSNATAEVSSDFYSYWSELEIGTPINFFSRYVFELLLALSIQTFLGTPPTSSGEMTTGAPLYISEPSDIKRINESVAAVFEHNASFLDSAHMILVASCCDPIWSDPNLNLAEIAKRSREGTLILGPRDTYKASVRRQAEFLLSPKRHSDSGTHGN